ncbi:MAG: helix-turn-helix transcriptional regulator [Neptuniibacter sp.]
MEHTLSQLILEIHAQSKIKAPDEFRQWVVGFCTEHFGVNLCVWLESPENQTINSNHLFISGTEKDLEEQIKLLIQSELEQSSALLSEIDFLPSHAEKFLGDLVGQVIPKVSLSIERSITLHTSRIKNTLFLSICEENLVQFSLDDLHKIIPHLIEAYDASFLLYFSRLCGSHSLAIVDRKGMVLHSHYSFSENLHGYETDTLFNYSSIEILQDCRFIKFEQGYVKLAGIYNGLIVLAAVRHNKMSEKLTTKELSIAYQYSKGLTYKEVGKLMGISPSTVNNHLNNIYQKLAVNNKNKLLEVFEHDEAF